MTIKDIQLNNGIEMPQEGFGVYLINGFDKCKQAVLDALNTGYRAIDTAQMYGNEDAVGQAIHDSNVDRKDIFITTKIEPSNFSYEKTIESVEGSLGKLQTDYIDLVMTHVPFGDYKDAYRALEYLYQKGVVHAIGVSNLDAGKFDDLANSAEIPPVVNQVRTNVFNQQATLSEHTKKYQTYIEAWGPLGQGEDSLLDNQDLKSIGHKYNKTAAQVALRFLIQKNIIIIPKTTHKNRMKQNLDIWNFNLSDDDMQKITELNGQS